MPSGLSAGAIHSTIVMRFPGEIISHCLGYIFASLSASAMSKNVSDARRGTHLRKVRDGASSSVRLTRTACDAETPRPGDRGTSTKCSLKINGRLHYLWRAVDQDGEVLDILAQRHRDKKAAKKLQVK